MKRTILIAALALPVWMPAQERPADPQAKPAQDQTKKTPPASSTTDKAKQASSDDEALMPNLSRSPTGYVEDAAVGTMVRIRFDAGFDMTAPDRAEFFYGKCGCYRAAGLDPNAPGPGAVIVTRMRFQEAHANVEYAFARRFSLFVDASVRSIQPLAGTGPLFGSQTGPGDLQAGFKFAPLASPDGYLTFQLRSYFPTGDSMEGLGTNHYSIEPGLLFTRKVTPVVALSGQFSVWHPVGGSGALPLSSANSFAGNVLTYGAGVSRRFRVSENLRLAPVVELVGWSVRSGYVTLASGPVSASGENIVNAKLGARIYLGRQNSIYAGFGRQLSHVGWYRDFLRVEYAHVF
jgi:hypothetical protein